MNTNKKITRAQLICINVLMRKLGMETQSKTLVSSFSNGRETSRANLTIGEATDLIKWLKSQDPEEKKAETMRRKMISLAHEMNWREPGSFKVNMRSLDEWCVKYGYLHKKLNQYLYSELPKLVSQFEGVHKSFLNGI